MAPDAFTPTICKSILDVGDQVSDSCGAESTWGLGGWEKNENENGTETSKLKGRGVSL